MNRLIPALGALACLFAASTASAQDTKRVYDNGPVWDYSMIETKPGHFDDYMKYVSTGWRTLMEAQKAAGYVLDYKVLTVLDPRDNEPDLILAVEYKNAGVMDVPLDVQDAMMSKVSGSVSAAEAGAANRESIRKLRGDIMARELILK